MLSQVAFERNRGGQSVDMICRELMLDEEKVQTAKRARSKKKKGGLKSASQPTEEVRSSETLSSNVAANKATSSCSVSRHWKILLKCTTPFWIVLESRWFFRFSRRGKSLKTVWCLIVMNFEYCRHCIRLYWWKYCTSVQFFHFRYSWTQRVHALDTLCRWQSCLVW